MNKYLTNINKFIKYKSKYTNLYTKQYGGLININSPEITIKLDNGEKYIELKGIISVEYNNIKNTYIIHFNNIEDIRKLFDLTKTTIGIPNRDTIEISANNLLILNNYNKIAKTTTNKVDTINLTFDDTTVTEAIRRIPAILIEKKPIQHKSPNDDTQKIGNQERIRGISTSQERGKGGKGGKERSTSQEHGKGKGKGEGKGKGKGKGTNSINSQQKYSLLESTTFIEGLNTQINEITKDINDIIEYIRSNLKDNFYTSIIKDIIKTITMSKLDIQIQRRILSTIFIEISLNFNNKKQFYIALNTLNRGISVKRVSNLLEIANGNDLINSTILADSTILTKHKNKPVFIHNKCIICRTGIPEMKQEKAISILERSKQVKQVNRQIICSNCKSIYKKPFKQPLEQPQEIPKQTRRDINDVFNYDKLIIKIQIQTLIDALIYYNIVNWIIYSTLSVYDKFSIYKEVLKTPTIIEDQYNSVAAALEYVLNNYPVIHTDNEWANGYNFFSITNFTQINESVVKPIFVSSKCRLCDEHIKEVSYDVIKLHFSKNTNDFKRQFLCNTCKNYKSYISYKLKLSIPEPSTIPTVQPSIVQPPTVQPPTIHPPPNWNTKIGKWGDDEDDEEENEDDKDDEEENEDDKDDEYDKENEDDEDNDIDGL